VVKSTGVPALAELIDAARGAWAGPLVEDAVFGTAEPDAIATIVSGWCARYLGSPIGDGRFYSASVGCVLGVDLLDGQQVVVKAFQPRWTREFLEATQTVQTTLAAGGYPCPVPIGLPRPCGLGLAVADTNVADPGPTPFRPDLVGVAAAGLAELVGRCAASDAGPLRAHPLAAPRDRVFPQPHSPLFDFPGTEATAGWINAFGAAARAARDADRSSTIGHLDWTLRNVRYSDRGVRALYDLDSLAAAPETTIAGQASAAWSWHDGDEDRPLPGPDAAAEFLDHYGDARGRALSKGERVAASGAGLWILAYRARCEHALDPDAGADRGARATLRDVGSRFLTR
jgi:hypothetical protein